MKLSVIVPVLDVESTLPAQLDALAAQDHQGDWEVVIADNGSVDGTLEIARDAARENPRLTVVTGPVGMTRSVGAARNLGMRHATGDAVAFCDGDDVVAPGWVSAVVYGLGTFPAVTGPLDYDLLNPSWLRGARGAVGVHECPVFDDVFPFMNGANLAVRREVVDEVGPFDERSGAEDIEFALRLFVAGHAVGFRPDMVVHYRLRAEPATNWRQARAYGAGRRGVRRCLRERGLPARGPKWRNVMWLVRRLPSIRTRAGRYRWTWVLGNLVGETLGRADLSGAER